MYTSTDSSVLSPISRQTPVEALMDHRETQIPSTPYQPLSSTLPNSRPPSTGPMTRPYPYMSNERSFSSIVFIQRMSLSRWLCVSNTRGIFTFGSRAKCHIIVESTSWNSFSCSGGCGRRQIDASLLSIEYRTRSNIWF